MRKKRVKKFKSPQKQSLKKKIEKTLKGKGTGSNQQTIKKFLIDRNKLFDPGVKLTGDEEEVKKDGCPVMSDKQEDGLDA